MGTDISTCTSQPLKQAGQALAGGLLDRAEQHLPAAAAGVSANDAQGVKQLQQLAILKPLLNAAQCALNDCRWQEALLQAQACMKAIEHPSDMPCLAVKVLLIQADAASNLQQHETALEALDLALQLHPDHADALWKRAAIHAALGSHQASFFDLRRLSTLQPTYPGILPALQQAAKLCAEQRKATVHATAPRQRYVRTRRGQPADASATGAALNSSVKSHDWYRVLQLTPNATIEDIKRSYKQLAAKLHPDKWMQASETGRAVAEEKFKAVAAAYQALLAQI